MGGSGIVISSDGKMLTNHHVIAAAYDQDVREIPVTIDNRPYNADVLGTNMRGDLALLQNQITRRQNPGLC